MTKQYCFTQYNVVHTNPETKVYEFCQNALFSLNMASPAKKRKRNPNFRIEFVGKEDHKHSVLEFLQKIRSELTPRYNQYVGNHQVI